MAGNGINKNNGRIKCEQYRGTTLVFAPPVKWHNFSLPYSSEMVSVLTNAINFEEEAVLVAPDRFTAMMLKLESFGAHIPVVQGDSAGRRLVDEQLNGKP